MTNTLYTWIMAHDSLVIEDQPAVLAGMRHFCEQHNYAVQDTFDFVSNEHNGIRITCKSYADARILRAIYEAIKQAMQAKATL